MTSFWDNLPQPFFILAPLEAVTDVVFRHVVKQAGSPDVFFTEFANATGWVHAGDKAIAGRLIKTDDEHPLVAQIWGGEPGDMEQFAAHCAKLGFDGIDINMGCPAKSAIKSGGAALIRRPDVAVAAIAAAKTAGLPVSVKTRLGYTHVDEWHEWLSTLLAQNLANLTIHLRTKKEMSKVPAHYELINDIIKLRDEIAPQTLLTINGDIRNRAHGEELARQHPGVNGIMIGRGIFSDPFCFACTGARASHKTIRDPHKPAQIFSETPLAPDTPATAAPSALEAVKRSRGADVSAERSRSISSGDTSEKSTPAQERGAGDANFADDVQEAATADLHFEAKGEVITFDGFLRVYGGGKDEILPKLHSGDTLETHNIIARQTFARPPARYTEGSLVKKLEDLGIGRPSTYATIIDTVQTRGYVEKGDSEGQPRDVIVLSYNGEEVSRDIVQEKTGSTRGKLIPTPSGELIADFLTDHFTQIVDYDFTANVETEFDKIAAADLAKSAMLHGFYTPFHKLIEQSGGIDRSKVGANREVGIDPKSGKPILARFGRFGPMLQLGTTDDEDKPRFAPLPKGAKIETVTLEQALEMFKLPRIVGQTEDGQDIKANVGRFGPYIQVGKLFVSIKPEDPHHITLEKARELYAAKLQAEAEKNIAEFSDGVKVLNGRFGPYITDGAKNAKVPKDTDPKTITHEQALEILKAAPAKNTRRPGRRSSTSARRKK